MGRLAKMLVLLCMALLGAIVGLGFFVRGSHTDERIKDPVIPRATQALGRTIAIGDINIGLLRGIRLDDFVTMKSFVLNYDLLPLLQKKLVINEIDLSEPTLRFSRDKTGRFNFETRTILKKDQPMKVRWRRRLVFHRQMKYKIC